MRYRTYKAGIRERDGVELSLQKEGLGFIYIMDTAASNGTAVIMSRAELERLRTELFPDRYYSGEVGIGKDLYLL